jgi:hypothetical protein
MLSIININKYLQKGYTLLVSRDVRIRIRIRIQKSQIRILADVLESKNSNPNPDFSNPNPKSSNPNPDPVM